MQSGQVAAAVFWVGLALSSALSLILVAALGAVGFQPGPIWPRLLGLFLVLMPFAALAGRRKARDTKRFDMVTGLTMAVVVLSYAAVMFALNG